MRVVRLWLVALLPVLFARPASGAPEPAPGRQIRNCSFSTLDASGHRLGDFLGENGMVVAFTSKTCPLSQRHAANLARLEPELAARKIGLLLVAPFQSESAEEIGAFLASHGIRAAASRDSDKALASALGARTTTEVFLLDRSRTLLYRGALNDQYGLSHSLEAPKARYLAEAIGAMLAGRRPVVDTTEAPGCELDVPAPNRGRTPVTYYGDVSRILQQHCSRCHHDGGVGPFGLDTLDEVLDRAKAIERVVTQGQMPPWFAAPVAEGAATPWANDCSLNARDRGDLLEWIRSPNRPVGEVSDAPLPLKFESEWSIGAPDLVLQLPRAIDVKAEGFMPYQNATIETHLAEDKWVAAYEILPSERGVVHHVIVQAHPRGDKHIGRRDGASELWAAYVPGNGSRVFADGFAQKLSAESVLHFQIHYTPNGRQVREQMRIGLVFAKQAPRYEVRTAGIAQRELLIPPYAPDHVVEKEQKLPGAFELTGLLAHMHLRGKAFRFEWRRNDGEWQTLLDIPRYDFNWQLRYELKRPLPVPKGSTVRITATFDNSAGNKANPSPEKAVKWGEQTDEEMMIGYLEYCVPVSSQPAPGRRAGLLNGLF